MSLQGHGLTATTKAAKASAAVFDSKKAGQIRLIPHKVEFREGNSSPKLPSLGKTGEIKALVDKNGNCSLWLCVKRSETSGDPPQPRSAQWCEIQLGPAIGGTE